MILIHIIKDSIYHALNIGNEETTSFMEIVNGLGLGGGSILLEKFPFIA